MKKNLILSAAFIVIGCIACIVINQGRKRKFARKVAKLETDQAFMMDTFEPIEDFETVYFDENRGLVQIKIKK